MAVQFIVGGSGTGKTTYMVNRMIEKSKKEPGKTILYILPEQANMAAEQDMVQNHPNGGTMDISILSFTRLSFQVFDELGIKTNDILDDYGKNILIMRVLKNIENELVIYKNMLDAPGFMDEIQAILSEFYQYQVTDAMLEQTIAKLNPDKSLYYKLKDLRLIYKEFKNAIQEKYMVAEQVLAMLKEVAAESSLLRGASVYFDGFHGFTPLQYSIIEELIKMDLDLYFSVTMDAAKVGANQIDENDLFFWSMQMMDKIRYLAGKHKILVAPSILLKDSYRVLEKSILRQFEQNLFQAPAIPCYGTNEEIEFGYASTQEKEIRYVAKKIKNYVMQEGYRYKDFAIVTGNVETYVDLIKHSMNQMEIPFFLDYSEPFVHNPVVEVVWLTFEMFHQKFSYQSVFAFLKTGITSLSKDEICQLENYVLKYGVKGYSWWNHPFHGNRKGLKYINRIREKFMTDLKDIAPLFIKETATVSEYIHALYDYMKIHRMAEKLHEQSIQFEKQGQIRESKLYSQVYEKWLMVLDKTMDLMGDELIERDTLSKLLIAGISKLKLGVIPSTLDQVVIGDMERTRLPEVKMVFVVGLNDGQIPVVRERTGLIRDKERKTLKDADMELAPNSMENLQIQQYYFYSQVTKAGEKIFFSYSKEDKKKTEKKPSFYWNKMLSVLPETKIKNIDEELNKMLPATGRETVDMLAQKMMEEDMEDGSLYKIVRSQYKTEFDRIIEGYLYQNQSGTLHKSIVHELYGDTMTNSVSKLETFSACCYQFFLKYGLKIKKRDEYKVESSNLGTILHGVMEQFFLSAKEKNIDVTTLSDERRDSIVEELTVAMAKEENETIFDSGFRKRHQLSMLIRVAKRSVENLCRHLQQGDMKPTYFEKEFSPEDKLSYIYFALEQDMKMQLKGIVDRVDIKETDDAVYFKVIDYKSGAKDIDYLKIYEGKQLQLVVYMSVMKELLERQYPDKQVIPTGMYYYHLQDLIVDAVKEEDAEKKRMENSRLTGLVNEDETCRILMDHKTGNVVPLRYKTDGSLYSQNKALVSGNELEQISTFVKKKMQEIGNEIVQGKIDMNPEKGEVTGPCNFCDYKNICRFEPGLGGNHYSIHANLDREEAKEKVTAKEDKQNEMDK